MLRACTRDSTSSLFTGVDDEEDSADEEDEAVGIKTDKRWGRRTGGRWAGSDLKSARNAKGSPALRRRMKVLDIFSR
jgi:hypothetical protein